MSNKKSLYEILEVRPDATAAEIHASHQRLLQSLESQRSNLSREDYNNQLRLLKVAFSTLSAPLSRDSYDAHLSIRKESAKPPSLALLATPAADQGAAAIRAEALLVRADAMALRADALGLKADMLSGQTAPRADLGTSPVVRQMLGWFKTGLLTLGTLAAIGMVIKVVFLFTLNTASDQTVSVRSPADDRVFLQDYYQTWGVRPASRAEAELMDAQRRKNEEEKRSQRQLDEAKTRAEQDQRRFEDESRRQGEQVSAQLRYADERAKQALLQEERQKEDDTRRQAQAEEQRLAAERAKWQRVMGTSSAN